MSDKLNRSGFPHLHLLAAGALGGLLLAAGPLSATCYQAPFAACPNNDPAKSVLITNSAFSTADDDVRAMAFLDANDGTSRRYVPLQGGKILLWKGGAGFAGEFLDISDRVLGPVAGGNEQGLVALAFHPNYAENGFLYVMYVGEGDAPSDNGDIVIERYTRSLINPDIADKTMAQVVLVIDHEEGANHNGGWLAFGPDGFLYITTGDGGSGCDETIRDGQSITSPRGKLLRLDVDSTAGSTPPECDQFGTTVPGNYKVPLGNPFQGATAGCGEIWAMGLRNPFRFTFDRANGDIFIGDVGQDNWEEINYLSASAEPPVNFGWVCREGCDSSAVGASSCNDVELDAGCVDYTHTSCQYPSTSGYMDPNLCFSNPDGWASIVAGYRYRGSLVPALANRLFFLDVSFGQIWQTPAADLVTASCWDAGNGGTFAFGEDHLGELYFVVGAVAPGVAPRVECLHVSSDPDGCYWAAWGGIFQDGFESPSHDTSHWSDTVPPLAP